MIPALWIAFDFLDDWQCFLCAQMSPFQWYLYSLLSNFVLLWNVTYDFHNQFGKVFVGVIHIIIRSFVVQSCSLLMLLFMLLSWLSCQIPLEKILWYLDGNYVVRMSSISRDFISTKTSINEFDVDFQWFGIVFSLFFFFIFIFIFFYLEWR